MTSGFSGLPKLRLSTTASGSAPTTATLRAASYTSRAAPLPRIQITKSTVAIRCQCQGPAGPFDSQQSGVMSGTDDSVEEEHVVVLLVDP